ncbi:hypothetical protein ACFL6X_08405 [Candidatus Latescibacterota bacterium]
MGVDGNFKRLEDEVNRLLELLEQLRQENASLGQENESLREASASQKARIVSLEEMRSESEAAKSRLAQVETDYRQAVESREAVRQRVEKILLRLEEAPL